MNARIYQAIIGVLVVIVLVEGWWILRDSAASAQMAMQMQSAGMPDMGTSTAATTTTTTAVVSTGTTTPTQQVAPGTDAVTVQNQSAGMSVLVASVSVGQPTWIAIRDSEGRTLGAGLVATGTATEVSVPLLRATVAGQSYQVLLYADNGDHQFELNGDSLIENADGSVAGTTFDAQ